MNCNCASALRGRGYRRRLLVVGEYQNDAAAAEAEVVDFLETEEEMAAMPDTVGGEEPTPAAAISSEAREGPAERFLAAGEPFLVAVFFFLRVSTMVRYEVKRYGFGKK